MLYRGVGNTIFKKSEMVMPISWGSHVKERVDDGATILIPISGKYVTVATKEITELSPRVAIAGGYRFLEVEVRRAVRANPDGTWTDISGATVAQPLNSVASTFSDILEFAQKVPPHSSGTTEYICARKGQDPPLELVVSVSNGVSSGVLIAAKKGGGTAAAAAATLKEAVVETVGVHSGYGDTWMRQYLGSLLMLNGTDEEGRGTTPFFERAMKLTCMELGIDDYSLTTGGENPVIQLSKQHRESYVSKHFSDIYKKAVAAASLLESAGIQDRLVDDAPEQEDKVETAAPMHPVQYLLANLKNSSGKLRILDRATGKGVFGPATKALCYQGIDQPLLEEFHKYGTTDPIHYYFAGVKYRAPPFVGSVRLNKLTYAGALIEKSREVYDFTLKNIDESKYDVTDMPNPEIRRYAAKNAEGSDDVFFVRVSGFNKSLTKTPNYECSSTVCKTSEKKKNGESVVKHSMLLPDGRPIEGVGYASKFVLTTVQRKQGIPEMNVRDALEREARFNYCAHLDLYRHGKDVLELGL